MGPHERKVLLGNDREGGRDGCEGISGLKTIVQGGEDASELHGTPCPNGHAEPSTCSSAAAPPTP